MSRRSFDVDPQRNGDRVKNQSLRRQASWVLRPLSGASAAGRRAEALPQGQVESGMEEVDAITNIRLSLRGTAGRSEGGTARRAAAPNRFEASMTVGSSPALQRPLAQQGDGALGLGVVRADLMGIEVPETADRTETSRTGEERSAISGHANSVTLAFCRESSVRCRAGGPTIAQGETTASVLSLSVVASADVGLDIVRSCERAIPLSRVFLPLAAIGLPRSVADNAPFVTLRGTRSVPRAA